MTKFTAWSVDADNIKQDDFKSSEIERFIIRTNEINAFLEPGSESGKYFIVGPKGLGKTLLLKLKSLQLKEKSYQVLPQNQLCEKLDEVTEQFSYEDIHDLETERMWKNIWEMCLCCWIIKSFELELPDEINEILKDAKSLSLILRIFLKIGTKNIEKLYKKYTNTRLRPIVDDLQDHGVNQLALFIDNIDEALTPHVGESLRTSITQEDTSYLLSKDLWIYAQTSILKVAKRLMLHNSHLKIFVSIRSEAYNQITSMEKLQIDDLCIQLRYTKNQIKEIFIKNIRETRPERLSNPSDKDHIKRFIGFSSYQHHFVKDDKDNPVNEDIFDCIYRHTFGRPREIVRMGQEIFNLDVELRTVEKIHETINTVSVDLFKQFTYEIIPYFDMDLFKEFCREVTVNVIKPSTAEKVLAYFANKKETADIFSYYWNLGLLGISRQASMNIEKYIQHFRPVGQYSLSYEKIPANTFYLLHPATYRVLEEQRIDENRFDKKNIVGYDMPFIEPKRDIEKKRSHLHLGLDRDALSVILPAMYNYKAVAVYLEKPNNVWTLLSSAEYFHLVVDDKSYFFRVYRDDLPESKKSKIISDWFDEQQPTIFYSKDFLLINDVTRAVDTISLTDVNDLAFFDKLQSDSFSKNKIVSLCRKYTPREKIKTVEEKLKKKDNDWKFRNVLVDRFTYKIDKDLHNGDTLICKVTAEHYRGVQVTFYHPEYTVPPSQHVLRPDTDNEFNFWVREFTLLREGIYQYYKFLHQKAVPMLGDNNRHERLELFAFLQIEKLLDRADPDILRKVYGIDDKPGIRNILNDQVGEMIKRLNQLYENRNATGGQSVVIHKLKIQSVFISDGDFFKHIVHSKAKYDKPALVQTVMKDLGIRPSAKKFSKVFISYSFKDSDFSMRLASIIKFFGVPVDIFEFDDPKGNIKKVMADYVENNDHVLFVSSENSIKSEACHFELRKCREKYQRTWKDILIPIELDKHIHNVQEHDIPEEFRVLFWQNIKYIREATMKDFSRYKTDPNNQSLERDVLEKIVNKYLRKPNGAFPT